MITYFIDSHFHLDTILKRVGSSDFFQFTIEASYNDVMQFGIANFCFPSSWPSSHEREVIREEKRIRLTFGIHPRIVGGELQRVIDIWVDNMKHLLDSKKVIAVGECGLDTSDRPSSREWKKQVSTFKLQIKMARDKNLPIIIHCRGNKDISKECLSILTGNLPKEHPVHRHCFNGTHHEYRQWKKALPFCKFGVSPFIFNEDRYPHLRETLCEMDLKDLILESDAPYLQGENGKTALPTVVREVARKLATLHSKTTDQVADITSETARQLYRLSP